MMKMAFFSVPVLEPGTAAEELNQFLEANLINDVKRELVGEGADSVWAISISFTEENTLGIHANSAKSGVDYRETLNADDFLVYVKLRNLRQAISEETGVPVSDIFSDEQLATMAVKRLSSIAALGNSDCISVEKLERFGSRFLELLASLPPSPVAPPSTLDPEYDNAGTDFLYASSSANQPCTGLRAE